MKKLVKYNGMNYQLDMLIKYLLWKVFVKPFKSLFYFISNKHWDGRNPKPHYFCYKHHLFDQDVSGLKCRLFLFKNRKNIV